MAHTRDFTGKERGAALILSLGKEALAKLLKVMGSVELRELTQTIAILGKVTQEEIDFVLAEMA